PVQFHEEDFKLKEWNKDALTAIFSELEFKTLGKRILGDSFAVGVSAPVGVQTYLFGNAVDNQKAKAKTEKKEEAAAEENTTQTFSSLKT
ncbi:hypothetical protein ACSTLD_24035, partial [Vibrio parahaemolyticus]